ncbi:hypothetical protein BDB01DRAFT_715167 [Pilobolus umbonatus]|nr:hypothetical protein BDB01DRAFT_715167 [Pilobolus umbonatus]
MRKRKTEFRLLCRDTQGLSELEKMGGKIYKIDSINKHDLKNIMRNVFYTLVVPEHTDDFLNETKMVITEAKQAGVDYLAMYSISGIDAFSKLGEKGAKYPLLHGYQCLEQCVEDTFGQDKSCLFRTVLFHQLFYYFGPMIDDHKQIALPVQQKDKWGTICLQDTVDAVYKLSLDDSDRDTEATNAKKKNKFVFEFTARDNITGDTLAKDASEGLDTKISFKDISEEDYSHYLRDLRNDNRFKERPDSFRDDISYYMFPLGRYLNDHTIAFMVEHWRYIDRIGPVPITKDLGHAIKGQEDTIRDFFSRNKEQFRHIR